MNRLLSRGFAVVMAEARNQFSEVNSTIPGMDTLIIVLVELTVALLAAWASLCASNEDFSRSTDLSN